MFNNMGFEDEEINNDYNGEKPIETNEDIEKINDSFHSYE